MVNVHTKRLRGQEVERRTPDSEVYISHNLADLDQASSTSYFELLRTLIASSARPSTNATTQGTR